MHSHVHCSIIYNGEDMKTASLYNNEWMDKEDMHVCVYIYTQWNIIQLKKQE